MISGFQSLCFWNATCVPLRIGRTLTMTHRQYALHSIFHGEEEGETQERERGGEAFISKLFALKLSLFCCSPLTRASLTRRPTTKPNQLTIDHHPPESEICTVYTHVYIRVKNVYTPSRVPVLQREPRRTTSTPPPFVRCYIARWAPTAPRWGSVQVEGNPYPKP
jgi:hypothetical protein